MKTICFKTFWKLYLFNFMEINHRLMIDKGKGSCNGKRGERWYHSFDPSKYTRRKPRICPVDFFDFNSRYLKNKNGFSKIPLKPFSGLQNLALDVNLSK